MARKQTTYNPWWHATKVKESIVLRGFNEWINSLPNKQEAAKKKTYDNRHTRYTS